MKIKLLAALLALPLLSACVTVDTRTVSLANGDARAELRLVEDMWLGQQSFELWGINNTDRPVCVHYSERQNMSGAATYLVAPRSSRELMSYYQARQLYLLVTVSPDGVSCPRQGSVSDPLSGSGLRPYDRFGEGTACHPLSSSKV